MQVALYTDVLFAAYLMNKVRTSGGMKENIFLQTLLLKKTHLTGSTWYPEFSKYVLVIDEESRSIKSQKENRVNIYGLLRKCGVKIWNLVAESEVITSWNLRPIEALMYWPH